MRWLGAALSREYHSKSTETLSKSRKNLRTNGCTSICCRCQIVRSTFASRDYWILSSLDWTFSLSWSVSDWSISLLMPQLKADSRKFSRQRALHCLATHAKRYSGRIFAYAQHDVDVLEHLRSSFSNFFQVVKSNRVCQQDFGSLIRDYAKKENIFASNQSYFLKKIWLNVMKTYFTLKLVLLLGWHAKETQWVRSIKSQKLFQKLRTVCFECVTPRSQISKIKICRWDYATASS